MQPPIIERMIGLNIGADELARKTGTKAGYIEQIASGEERFPPMEVVEKIADALHWNVAEMIVEAELFRRTVTTVYWCDPEKNTECRKRGCAYSIKGGRCKKTKKPAFAMLDENGEPLKAPNEGKEKQQERQYP